MRTRSCIRIGIIAWAVCVLPAALFGQSSPATRADSPAGGPAGSALFRGTVLQVNDDAVTSADVIGPLREALTELAARSDRRDFLLKAPSLIAQSAAERVREILLYQHAKRLLEKNENFDMALENQMTQKRQEFLAQFDGSAARAQEELEMIGTNIDDQLEAIKRSLIVEVYRELHIMPTLEVTRDQMYRYYRRNLKEKFYQKSKVQFQLVDIQVHRFLPDSAALRPTDAQMSQAREQARQAAEQAYRKLQAGADFSDVVKEYSHGHRRDYEGLWRPLDPESLQSQYQPLVAALQDVSVGRVCGVVESEDHFFIAKLIDRQPERVIPFTEAQTEIDLTLRRQLFNQRSKKLIDDLLQKATIGDLELFVENVTRLAWDQCKAPIPPGPAAP
ncbi:MAG: peptidyl-prolyl cis-trans isomerase [Sedimentisphaerales bacterium]|nr:peptidyl-prolyl cis-trans isomerase [Sedimentisphaerales bacterium]